LKAQPVFRLLALAARENCPEAFDNTLYLWLAKMGIRPPEGVFQAPLGAPGRPRAPETAAIYKKWLEIGEPPLSRRTLAYKLYGSDFTRASAAERKKVVDRCRRAVERHQTQLRRNPISN
jgi:hypothetical protein